RLGGHLNWDWATNLIADAEARAGSGDTKLSIVSKTGVVLVGPQKDQTRFSGEELAGMVAAHDGSFMETAAGQRLLPAFPVGPGHNEYQGLNWIVIASQPASVALAVAITSAQLILGIGVI